MCDIFIIIYIDYWSDTKVKTVLVTPIKQNNTAIPPPPILALNQVQPFLWQYKTLFTK